MKNIVQLSHIKKTFRVPNEKRNRFREHLTAFFKKQPSVMIVAADDLSLSVPEGQFLGIIGPNGAGKSTLLKLMANVLYPEKGHISVVGRVAPFLELGVGFQPQLTGRDNVFFYGVLLGLSIKEIRRRYDTIVAFAELEGYMEQLVKNYSTGMQMRLAFAITSHVDADVVLIDEALAVGDEHFQQKCLAYMDTLRRQNKTIIFVSHDLVAIERHCDRVLVLDNGKIVKDGNPKESVDFYKAHLHKKEGNQEIKKVV